MEFLSLISLLAEGEAAQPQPSMGEAFRSMAPMLVVMVFLMYFMVFRPQGRERKEREALLAGLKKNDRVVTFSGIIGVVTGFSGDGKEVTLRVDDSVKLNFLRSAIQGPLRDASADTNKVAS